MLAWDYGSFSLWKCCYWNNTLHWKTGCYRGIRQIAVVHSFIFLGLLCCCCGIDSLSSMNCYIRKMLQIFLWGRLVQIAKGIFFFFLHGKKVVVISIFSRCPVCFCLDGIISVMCAAKFQRERVVYTCFKLFIFCFQTTQMDYNFCNETHKTSIKAVKQV